MEHLERVERSAIQTDRREKYSTGLFAALKSQQASILRELAGPEELMRLDLGCGEGLHFHLGPSVGVDPSAVRLRRASLRIPNLVRAVGEHLPLRRNIFDEVLCVDVMEHVFSYTRVLTEAWRVLRKRGRLIVNAVNGLVEGLGRVLVLGRRTFKHEEHTCFPSPGDIASSFSGRLIRRVSQPFKFLPYALSRSQYMLFEVLK